MKYGLRQEIINQICETFSLHPEIEEAILYGSRAKGTYKDASDIDIVLKGENLNLHIIGQLNQKIDDLLLPYKFDISAYHKISNPDLIEHIERVGKIIYTK
jgi:predicted nucleotidyltransferase